MTESPRCATCRHYLPADVCAGYPAMREHGYHGACAYPKNFHRVIYIPEEIVIEDCGLWERVIYRQLED